MPDGRRAVDTMLQLHTAHYPEYITELRGLADGAGVPFKQVLMANMRQELLALAQPHQQQHEDSCSDVLLSLPAPHGPPRHPAPTEGAQPPATTLIGHNEDMTRDTIGRIYFVRYNADASFPTAASAARRRTGSSSSSSSRRLMRRQAAHQQTSSREGQQRNYGQPQLQTPAAGASPPPATASSFNRQGAWSSSSTTTSSSSSRSSTGGLSWLGFVYAGELASSGFGFNSAGIGFSLNAVFPAAPLMPGFSRNFVSRQLLQARSIDEALAIISRPGQAVGHSYNLFDLHSRRLLNVEVGPGGASSVLEVRRGSFYFHANMFKHLVLRQRIDASSFHREARALQLQAPRDAAELLGMLGDTADPEYPIYRHGNSTADAAVVTLCTALFDLEAGTMRVWTGNPGDASSRRLQLQFDLHTLQLLEEQ
ncbi:hypothetical protein OEZ85_008184 [Tetradesmus obliquus]|uniref:Peptidase C45 hydrolase domain-containing protein n=1 Tax=Tetradesmus obliquus TaxID=3088 RepID=A0ABY8TLQ6_TETOB|nr:hypothetical protein OEZ85_008184 [Tetradesmus obliquus]